MKKKVQTRFLNINATEEHSVAHIQHLSKLNGIFFPKGTMSKEGKQSFINKMVHTLDKQNYSIVSRDKYSVQKILGYISHPLKKEMLTSLIQLVNPYAKTPKNNNSSNQQNLNNTPPSPNRNHNKHFTNSQATPGENHNQQPTTDTRYP